LYETHFGLTGSPFRLSPDPRFFFGSKGHKRALAYLRYGLTQREGFIVVTGSPGTGKTTLARALLDEVAKNKIIVSELNTTHLEADDVLRMVAASFGLEHENLTKASLLKRLERFFLTKYRAGYHCLLVVDESQNLPFGSLEELRMLSNFYAGKHALLQIFLLGQQQFRDALYDPKLEQLRQRVVAATHLDPLNAKETRAYIIHRLNHVGWKQNPTFTQRAFAYIYTLTKGVPRRINTFCDRLMLFASLEDISEINDTHVKDVAKELMYEVTSHKSDSPTKKETDSAQTSLELTTIEEPTPSEIILIEEEFRQEEELLESDISKTEIVKNAQLSAPDEIDTNTQVPVVEIVAQNENKNETIDEEHPTNTKPKNKSKKRKGQSRSYADATTFHKSRNNTQISPRKNIEHKPQYLNQQPGFSLVALAIDYYQNPNEYKELLRSSSVLPPGIAELFRVAMGKLHIDLDDFEGLTDLTQADLKEAARRFIKEILLSNASDYYRRLGLTKTASQEQIKAHYQIMFKLFQPDQEKDSALWNESFAIKINQAYVSLREKTMRDAYDYFLDSLEIVELDHEIQTENEFADVPRVVDAPPLKQAVKSTEKTFGLDKKIKMIIAVLISITLGLILVLNPSILVLNKDDFFDSPPINSIPGLKSEDIPLSLTEEHEINQIDNILNSDSEFGEPALLDDVTNPMLSSIDNSGQKIANELVVKKTVESKIDNIVVKNKVAANNVAKGDQKPKVSSVKTSNELDSNAVIRSNSMISEKELNSVMSLFYKTYEEGDLKEFIRLFYKNAITNDRKSRMGIAKDYSRLFSSTDRRSISINNLEWNIEENKASGIGDFIVRTVKSGEGETKSFEGTIRLVVLKERGKIKFKEMYHAYSEE